tara:strand:+ start:1210 stop:1431 length:222 start_codon:yes stop_codon:yes gene_type:complete
MSEKQLDTLQVLYRQVFNSAEGLVVLDDLKKRFNINGSTFERGDPHYSAYLEGQRSVVLSIMRFMEEKQQRED